MKFTILGASGFIGSHFTDYLTQKGKGVFTPSKEHKFSKNENLGHIIYSIGLTADFRQKPMETVKAHVCKLLEVLENSTFESFLYLSSARVYGGSKNGSEEAKLEVAPADLSDLYNISKLMGESICFSIPNDKVRVIRLANVIGSDFSSDNFLFSLIKDAIDKQEIKLEVPRDSAKDYISVDDVVSLIELIATNGSNRIYNISSGQPISNSQLIDEIKKYTNCKVDFSGNENGLVFPVIENERIKKEFSYKPKSILSDIKKLVEHYKAIKT